MNILAIVLLCIVSVLLVLLVLVQNSKGGGLASSFSSNNQIMGVRKTTDFLEKGTWGLAAALFVLSIIATATSNNVVQDDQIMVTEQVEKAASQMQQSTFPIATDEAETTQE